MDWEIKVMRVVAQVWFRRQPEVRLKCRDLAYLTGSNPKAQSRLMIYDQDSLHAAFKNRYTNINYQPCGKCEFFLPTCSQKFSAQMAKTVPHTNPPLIDHIYP